MNQEDRYHTTSWDGRQVRRQAEQSGSGGRSPSRPSQGGGKAKKRRRGNPFLGVILWLMVVVASSAILAGVGWMLANDLCSLNKPALEATVEIPEEWITSTREVEQDDGTKKMVTTVDMSKVTSLLKEEGLIQYGWFFRLFASVMNADEKIGVGVYQLNTEMDYRALIYGMIPSRSVSQLETVKVTIPEGYTVEQTIALLAENGVNTAEELREAAANHIYDSYAFIDNENLGSVSRLEGYLYPDTYEFYVGENAAHALERLIDNFSSRIYANEDFSALLESQNYDLREIIIIASLIEKETDGSDREMIASVIYNRLENTGETAHLLQIDAALVYAAGRAITQEDYATLDSPYNLYQHTGLPPTAIANPGMASIRAALQPAQTNYYYYVLGSDGKHIFSETLAQHNAVQAGLGN